MGKSFSKKVKYSSAEPPCSSDPAAGLETVAWTKAGSAASNLLSSAARSLGRAGAEGDGGALKFLTIPACASLA